MPNNARSRRSSVIEAHDVFEKYHKHLSSPSEEKEPVLLDEVQRARKPNESFPMFHRVMKTGVIYATTRAKSNGFSAETEEEWAK